MDKNKLVVATYNKIATIYPDTFFTDPSDNPYVDKFLEIVPETGHILDVGSGHGRLSKYIFQKGRSVTGIDMAEKMIDIARTRVPGVSFRQMDMRTLDYPDKTFDGILAAYSLIHIPSIEIPVVLKEFKRVLKPGGHVMIIAQQGQADRIVDEPLMVNERMFFNFFTKQRLEKYLRDELFRIQYQSEVDTDSDPTALSHRTIYTIAKKV